MKVIKKIALTTVCALISNSAMHSMDWLRHTGRAAWENTRCLATERLRDAVYKGRVNEVRLLLHLGTDHTNGSLGDDGLMNLAAGGGSVDMIQLLLSHGLSPVGSYSYDGGNPIHRAASKDKHEAVGILLDYGADIEDSNGSNGSPLCTAASIGATSTARLLLERGANKECTGPSLGHALHSLTPLQLASYSGHTDMMQLLLGYGANLDTNGGYDRKARAIKYTLLHLAATHCHIPAMVALIAYDVDLEARNRRGRTPLQHAACRPRCPFFPIDLEAVRQATRLLISHGADIGGENKSTASWALR